MVSLKELRPRTPSVTRPRYSRRPLIPHPPVNPVPSTVSERTRVPGGRRPFLPPSPRRQAVLTQVRDHLVRPDRGLPDTDPSSLLRGRGRGFVCAGPSDLPLTHSRTLRVHDPHDPMTTDNRNRTGTPNSDRVTNVQHSSVLSVGRGGRKMVDEGTNILFCLRESR